MLRHIGYRLLLMIPTLLAISVVTFIIIELPPGDYAESRMSEMIALGDTMNPEVIQQFRARYGLDLPPVLRYFHWLGRMFKGDLGQSFEWNRTVNSLIVERLPYSMAVSLMSLLIVWGIGIPIGVYSATHRNTFGDACVTIAGYAGLATPAFLAALIMMWIYYRLTGNVSVGLFSDKYISQPWSVGKALDFIRNLWMPGLIVGLSGTAGIIRTMRANLLDELQKPYVAVARAKGLSERRLLYKYPFRIACNPVISTIGWILPNLVGGELLVSMVLGIPTLAPILVGALKNQDMYLAGGVIMVLSALTVIGTLISDILLAWVDPRIRGAV